MAENTDGFSLKDYLIALPLLVSALALTYDICYFWGAGLAYASVFSISEHLGFAITALPAAFAIALGVPLGVLGFEAGRRGTERAQLKSFRAGMSESEKAGALEAATKRHIRRVGLIVAILLFAGGISAIVTKYYGSAGVMFALTAMIATDVFAPHIIVGYRGMAVCMLALAFVMSGGFGYDAGREPTRRAIAQQRMHTASGDIDGELMRSGEHGVFFFNFTSKKVGLWPWEDVKLIENLR
jgi:hypothetical protein